MTKLLDESAKGVYIIAATPFTDAGALDLESTDRMVDFYLAAGVDGLTILGVMGEAPKLSLDESVAFTERVAKRVAGKVPIIVGASAAGIAPMQALTRRVMDLGAAGVMVSPMAGLKTDEAVEGYVASVVKALDDTPIVLQDYPQLSGVYLSVPLIDTLFKAFPTLKVLKHEDWPGLRKLTRLRAGEAAGARRRISMLVGNSALFLPLDRKSTRLNSSHLGISY